MHKTRTLVEVTPLQALRLVHLRHLSRMRQGYPRRVSLLLRQHIGPCAHRLPQYSFPTQGQHSSWQASMLGEHTAGRAPLQLPRNYVQQQQGAVRRGHP